MERNEAIGPPANRSVIANNLIASHTPIAQGPQMITPQVGGAGCGCSGAADASADAAAPPSYVFAIGSIQMRFPSLGLEKEFVQATGRAETAGLTNQQAIAKVLARPENRYLARQMCWVMTIEGLENYLLVPRDSDGLDLLLAAIRENPTGQDVDVVIGLRGPVAPPEMCNGLVLPMVGFDQIFSFDRETLINAIPTETKLAAREDKQFRTAAGDLYDRITQITDNAGATDEHRALNYLAVRFPSIYGLATDQYDKNFGFAGVETQPSRLSGVRNIISVIFSFTNRVTGVTDRFYVRVDVTEEFPFLVSGLQPYYER